jgi:hypothetical protein
MNLPIIGGVVRGARSITEEGMNRALADRVTGSIGEKFPDDVPVGKFAIEYARDRLNLAHDRALQLVQDVTPDQQYRSDIVSRLNIARKELTFDTFNELKELTTEINKNLQINDISGGELQGLNDKLDLYAESPEADSSRNELFRYKHFNGVKEDIAALAGRQNPGYQVAKNAIDQGQAYLDLWKGAAERAKRDDGLFSAPDLYNEYKSLEHSPFSQATGRGGPPMSDFVNNVNTVMGSKIPAPSSTQEPYHFDAGLFGLDIHPSPILAAGVRLGAKAMASRPIGAGGTKALATVDPITAAGLIPQTNALTGFRQAVPLSVAALYRTSSAQQDADQGGQQAQ